MKEKKIFNLPNQLTILRVILILPFVLLLLGCEKNWGFVTGVFGRAAEFIALALFIAASLTDMADGKIARKYNLVTNFGKFMDPLADKLLVCSAMIVLVEMGRIPAWIVIIIISREFVISGFRLVASDNGVVIAASYWGKFKTVFQMIMIGMMIVQDVVFVGTVLYQPYLILTQIVMWIALILTLVSLADYLMKNWKVLLEVK